MEGSGDSWIKLREWAEKEVPGSRRDEKIFRIFLEGCKHDSEVAKRKFKNFYQMRESNPEWFRERDPTEKSVLDLLELGVLLPLPSKDGRTAIIVRATANDPGVNPMTDVFKVGIMVVELALERDEAIAKNGVHVIIDLGGVGLGHALQMTPSLVKRAVHSWQDCYPIRIKGIDFINCPTHVNIILSLIKRFANEKMRKRIRAHPIGKFQLDHVIRVNDLPYEYGGRAGPLGSLINLWKELVVSRRDWFVHGSNTPLQF